MKKLVSIIIPYFNDEKNIYNAIKSANKQNYKKREIIIIDDENTINSKNILKKIKSKIHKIKIFNTHGNQGVAIARNLGIKKSRGKFIAFLDSDDLWKKDKIKEQIKFIKKYKLDVCYTNYLAIKNNNKIIYKVRSPKMISYNTLLKECSICCSSVVIKKEVLKKIKFQNLKTKEDYMLWLDLSKKGYKFFGINKFLSFYRIRSNSLSNLHLNKIYSAFKIYSYYLNYNFLYSIFFVLRLYLNAFKKKYSPR